jgi:outer membrane protein assembly factor BamA
MSPLDVFTHKDFLKKQDLQITGGGRYSTRVKRIRLGLLQEHVLGSPFFIGAEGTGHLEKDARYKLKGAGFDVYGGMMVGKNTKMTIKFENEDVTMYRINDAIAPAFFQQDAGYHRVNTADLLFEHSTLNDQYYPTQGNNEKLEWDRSAKGLGSDYDFDRLEGQWRYYITPGEGKFFTYAFRTKLGWVDNYGSSEDVPYFERFFAGGVGTIRGYGNYGVGPRDSNDLPLGGDLLWVSNAEVRFPLYKKLVGAYFIDLGDIWDKASDITTHTLKSSTGIALLYVTPWGVARVDWGIRTSRDKDEPSSTVEATFGIPF